MAGAMAGLRGWVGGHRALIGKFAFELAIVFVGVTAAFALENVRQQHEEAAYRGRMIAALGPSLNDVVIHGGAIDAEVGAKLKAFDAALARGERPALPVYRESGGERPPTRAWDGIVATGAAKALSPAMFYRLANLFNTLDSVGERYIRYNDFTEAQVMTLADPQAAYDPATGRLKPAFRAYVDRLRDLKAANLHTVRQAAAIRDALARRE